VCVLRHHLVPIFLIFLIEMVACIAMSQKYASFVLSLTMLTGTSGFLSFEHVRTGLSVERPRLRNKHSTGVSTCTPLANKGTFSTVEISVGTPVQKFDVVADTGSNAVIVLSCTCVESGHCDSGDKCFVGTNQSSTFDLGSLSELSDGAGEGVPSITLSFGSGDIQAVVATDEVTVAKKETRMGDGLLLMVDKQLDFGGPFEGILGLGIPAHVQAFLQGRHASLASQAEPHAAMRRLDNGEAFEPPEFLASAGVSRFSICFNDGGASGVLRLGTQTMPKSLGSVGQLHWGLGMTGVSVGNSHSHVQICSSENMREGQMTPCGAIPDSGTTSIMAPKAHLEKLFESICDDWSRCSEESEKTGMSKPSQFTQLLRDCGSWLDESTGLAELPSLHFHVTGSEGGQSETLELGAWAYVLETVEDEYDLAARHLDDIVPDRSTSKESSKNRVCSPAFGVMEMPTQLNGDVWILGTPIFYAFNVHYNLEDSPPSIAFEEEECGTCDDEAHQELFVEGRRSDVVTSSRGPRQMRGAWRLPTIDVNGPM